MTDVARSRQGRLLRFGFLADGVFKLLVAATYLVLLSALAEALEVNRWLLVATAALVAVSGAAEIAFAIRSGSGSHTWNLIAYDAGWVVTTAVAILLAVNGVAVAGAVWLIYQLLASPVIAALFASGARRPEPSRLESQR